MSHIQMPAPIHDDGTYSAEQMQAYADACYREAIRHAAMLTAAGLVVGVAEEPELQHQLFGTS